MSKLIPVKIYVSCIAMATIYSLYAGETYYVATSGSDSNNGGLNSPWQTLDHAIHIAGPGDTVMMRGGNYDTDEVWIRGDRGMGGADGQYLTIRNFPGEEVSIGGKRSVIVAADFVRFEGLHFRLPYRITGGRNGGQVVNCAFEGSQPSYGAIEWSSDNGLLEGNTIIITGNDGDTKDHGIYLHAGHNNIVRKNYISGAAGYGIHGYDAVESGGDKAARGYRNITIEENIVVNCRERSGIIIFAEDGLTAENVVIQRNIIAFNNHNGVRIRMNSRDIKILNNTIFGNGAGASHEDDQSAVSIRDGVVRDVIIQNNIIEIPVNTAFHVQNREESSGIIAQRNLYWHGGSPKFHNISDPEAVYDDPLFLNPEGRDFRLTSHSPAIDAGLDVGLPFKGSAPDLGAYESDDMTTEVKKKDNLQVAFRLFQNYPNPFNPETEIVYQVSEPAKTRIIIFDLAGREVRTLVDNQLDAGSYRVVWDGSDNSGREVASGVYFYRVEFTGETAAGLVSDTKKMILLH